MILVAVLVWAGPIAPRSAIALTLGHEPAKAIIERAVTLQRLQTEAAIAAGAWPDRLPSVEDLDLALAPDRSRLRHLRIDDRQALRLDGQTRWHIRGRYDLEPPRQTNRPGTDRSAVDRPARSPSRDRVNLPFEVWLQEEQPGSTWRLARPQRSSRNGERVWATYRL